MIKCPRCRTEAQNRKEHCESVMCTWWQCIRCGSVNELKTNRYYKTSGGTK